MSTRKLIMKFASEHPDGFTAGDLTGVINSKTSRKSVMLWQLKKDGVLEHNKQTGVYKLVKPIPVIEDTVTKAIPEVVADTIAEVTAGRKKRKYTRRAKKADAPSASTLVKRLQESEKYALLLQPRLDYMRKEYKVLSDKYTDALAIIRYLEDKLFKAIQHDARNENP